jgi:hypothetical protein
MKSHDGQATRSLFTTEARKGSVLCSLQFIGSALIVIGFFGPWVAHKTAGLTVTGYELSEFAKFFPQVQGGAVPVRRALFITPLLAAVVSLALVIQRSGRGRAFRFAGTATALLLGLVALPPFQAIFEPQYRLHLALLTGGVLLTLATPLARQLSEGVRGIWLLFLTLVGAAPALWQITLLHPLVVELYSAPVWPDWGLIVCAIGFLTLLVASLRDILRP